jgi:hypothetical protein
MAALGGEWAIQVGNFWSNELTVNLYKNKYRGAIIL